MKELFKVKDLTFYKEDFLGDIEEYSDIIELVKDLQDTLDYQAGTVENENECCHTKENLLVQINGFINKDDEFITKEEFDLYKETLKNEKLDLFVIKIFKCVNCGKWDIEIEE